METKCNTTKEMRLWWEERFPCELAFLSSREKLLLYFSFLSITFITKKISLPHSSIILWSQGKKNFRETEMSTLKKCLWILYTVFKNYKKVSFWNKIKKFFGLIFKYLNFRAKNDTLQVIFKQCVLIGKIPKILNKLFIGVGKIRIYWQLDLMRRKD